MEKKYLKHFNIAGLTYWDAVDVFKELSIGTQLQFKSEPDNNTNLISKCPIGY